MDKNPVENVENEKPVEDKIVEIFTSQLMPIDVENARSWDLPAKSVSEIKTRVEYGDRISDNIIKSITKLENYDVTYIKSLFKKIDQYLSNGIPFVESESEFESEFVFPDVEYNDKLQGYNQLNNKKFCEEFISKVTRFGLLKNGRDGIKLFYLLGYVGSGKSTFINYILNLKSEEIAKRSIIVVHFDYDDIKEEIYKDETDQKYWDKIIWDLFLDKVKSSFYDPDFIKLTKKESQDEKESEIDVNELKRILFIYNILVVFDGLDSLSPNKIEKTNNSYIIIAIMKCLKQLKRLYNNQAKIRKNCHVIYSLRKCTYDMPDRPILSRRSEDDAYFLPAPKFDHVIEKIINFISKDKKLLRENEEKIINIIRLASQKLEGIFNSISTCNNRLDIFDNNYRRRLRYISSIIIVMALRVSNNIKKEPQKEPQKDINEKDEKNIHKIFFNNLEDKIKNLPDYLAFDILVYGVNTGFNNHFSSAEEEDNLGSLCGFIDNIFCYFPFDNMDYQGTLSIRMILKLRVLQILHSKKDLDLLDNNLEFQYLSLSKINEELLNIGIRIPEKELKDTIDFLEKSLFIRSTKPYKNRRGASRNELHFKCSNLGAALLEKIIFTYAYISGVAQNSCLPDRLSENVVYKKKSLNIYGSMLFINKKWVMEVIPNILLFLRVLKQVELNNPKAEDFFIHEKMLVSCKDSISNIIHTKNNQLSVDEKEYIYSRCNEFFNLK